MYKRLVELGPQLAVCNNIIQNITLGLYSVRVSYHFIGRF